ncbi:hypothetical protein FRB96_007416, partial [Tulasnella sp. 330]
TPVEQNVSRTPFLASRRTETIKTTNRTSSLSSIHRQESSTSFSSRPNPRTDYKLQSPNPASTS